MNPKLGSQWTTLWIPKRMVPGETYDSLAIHARKCGVQVVTVRWGVTDHPSRHPHGEIYPGEFWYGGEVERDANGDLTTSLFSKDEPAPTDSPMRMLLDACDKHGLKVLFQTGEWVGLKASGTWDFHPYKKNRLNAKRNMSKRGVPGWLTSRDDFFTDRQAKAAYKNRLDAFITSFGSHPAIWCVDLGNEFTHVSQKGDEQFDREAFFPWVAEMSDYLWQRLPGADDAKPFVTVSNIRVPPERHVNQAYQSMSSSFAHFETSLSNRPWVCARYLNTWAD